MRLAVIPARGGSKRIPGKNIREFCGQPMIHYAIAAAQDSGLFDKIIVSTDDETIAEVARRAGAEIPFMRPSTLADDHTGTTPVICHAIETGQQRGWDITEVCCIYATVPFLTGQVVQASYELLQREQADFCFTASHFDFPVYRGLHHQADGSITPAFPEHIGARSQDLPELIHDAGQLYWGKASAFLAGTPIFGPSSRAYLLPRHQVVDIDTEEDWVLAERLKQAMTL